MTEHSIDGRNRPSAGILILAALVLVYCGANFYLQVPRAASPMIGVVPSDDRAGPPILKDVDPDGPAGRAGLRPGDVLREVNGRKIWTWADYDGARELRRAGKPMRVVAVRDKETVLADVTPGRFLSRIEVVLGIAFSLFTAAIGLLCYLRSPHDRRTILALFVFLSFAAVNSNIAFDSYDRPGTLLMRVVNDATYSIGFGLLWLLPAYVPHPIETVKRRFVTLGAAFFGPGLLWLALSWWQAFGGANVGKAVDWLNIILLYATFLVLPLVSWVQCRRHQTGAARQQARTLFAGFLVYSVVNCAALTSLDYWPRSALSSGFFTQHIDVLVPLTVFFAVYRHRLFDIDVVIRRGLIYTATSGLLLGLYLLLAATISFLLASLYGGENAALKGALAGLTVGLLVMPAYRASQRIVDRIFYRRRFDYLSALPALFAELASTVENERHATILLDSLERAFRPRSLAVLLPDEEGHRFFVRVARGIAVPTEAAEKILLQSEDRCVMELVERARPLPAKLLQAKSLGPDERSALATLNADHLVPVMLNERLVAIVVLGPKASETPYNTEEIAFLTAVAGQSAALLENSRLLELASRDALTGLLRRSAFEPIFEREILRSRRHNHPLTFLMLDLDYFKAVNDRYGHRGGDIVLKAVAASLRESLRATDTIGRFGGEEFVVLLPETDPSGAERLAESLRKSIADHIFTLQNGQPIRLTVSIGVFTGAGTDLPPLNEIEDRADGALYEAKHAGRNRVMFDRGTASDLGTAGHS